MIRSIRHFSLCFISLVSTLSAMGLIKGSDCYIGPEVYYARRLKEGGGEQTGTMWGVRAGFERVKRYKLYYALEGLYSQGTLDGHAGDSRVRSEFTNSNVEARLGYTFQMKCAPYFSFTPFVGAGYMWEYSAYKHPTPICVHFDNRFPYIPFGFLSSIRFYDCWEAGLNLTVRFLWDGTQKVTHDPHYDKLTQCYEDHLQYRIELPIVYNFSGCWSRFTLRLTPFFEYRHYGHSINFPFDFLDTKYEFYGANLEVLYRF